MSPEVNKIIGTTSAIDEETAKNRTKNILHVNVYIVKKKILKSYFLRISKIKCLFFFLLNR